MTNAAASISTPEWAATSSTPTTLEANLAALSRTSPGTVARIRESAPRPDARFSPSDEPSPAVSIELDGERFSLTSARKPLEEGRRLTEGIDLAGAGAAVVFGFGAGYHVAALAERMKRTGLVVVFEPDVPLLRAVLERTDFSGQFRASNTVILTDPDDSGAIADALRGTEGLLAMGVRLVEHPASRQRLNGPGAPGPATRFTRRFTDVLRAVRTNVVTTLVQVRATIRNLIMNVDHYACCEGIDDLRGIRAGRPAIVVSAGPSLARNIDVLAEPGVRDRFTIIAAQTVLKPLLARGIRPHLVTALDHHEISRRFYEGLTAPDVEGVTLVVEPKANAAILDAFPGRIRCVEDRFLNDLLGPGLARAHGVLPPGATVAHLAYSLARHLGCDPVVLMGQDLGFTDGQYYAAGAAIHGVWAGELNHFNTLEMLEWQRIVRGRAHLRRLTDLHGRPIYTDEQMAAYLVQFERDFKTDAARGLTTIDATEGGVAKNHTAVQPLRDVVRHELARPRPDRDAAAGEDPLGPASRPPTPRAKTLERVEMRLREVRQGVHHVARLSRAAVVHLAEMLEHHLDQERVNRLIGKVEAIRNEVMAIAPGYRLTQYLNQTGAFNRLRSDRAMHFDDSLTPMARQRAQIDRDLDNVSRLLDCAVELEDLLDVGIGAQRSGPKRTRDPNPENPEAGSSPATVVAALMVARGPWTPAREQTLVRLARCAGIDRFALLTDRDSPGTPASLAGRPITVVRLSHHRSGPSASIAARSAASLCWRAGLANATIYDELLSYIGGGSCGAGAAAEVLAGLGADAGLFVDADWPLVDPAACGAVIDRYRENPEKNRLTFTQSAPGLCGCVVARSLLTELARSQASPNPFASLGGLLSYIPTAPSPDLIARPVCATIDPGLRDAGRFGHALTAGDLAARVLAGPGAEVAAGAELAERIRHAALTMPPGAPTHLIIDVGGDAPTTPSWAGSLPSREPMNPEYLGALLQSGDLDPARTLITLGCGPGSGDPLLHPDLPGLLRAAAAGAGPSRPTLHLRSSLLNDPAALDALPLDSFDILSADILAATPATYRRVTGRDGLERALVNFERILNRRAREQSPGSPGGPIAPWLVARITRCDAVYEEIEAFYDRFTLLTGAAVIDPLPFHHDTEKAGHSIRPLPLPAAAAERAAATTLRIGPAGEVYTGVPTLPDEDPVGNAITEGLLAPWKRVLALRAVPGAPPVTFG